MISPIINIPSGSIQLYQKPMKRRAIRKLSGSCPAQRALANQSILRSGMRRERNHRQVASRLARTGPKLPYQRTMGHPSLASQQTEDSDRKHRKKVSLIQ